MAFSADQVAGMIMVESDSESDSLHGEIDDDLDFSEEDSQTDSQTSSNSNDNVELAYQRRGRGRVRGRAGHAAAAQTLNVQRGRGRAGGRAGHAAAQPVNVQRGRGRAGHAAAAQTVNVVDAAEHEHEPEHVYIWSKSDEDPPLFLFVEDIGLRNPLPANASPMQYFELLFNEEFVNHIVTETNCYAQHEINQQRPLRHSSRLNNWKAVTQEEMRIFVGLLLQMGPIVLPTLSHYWLTTNVLYKTSLWSSCTSRNRFQVIL
jgi:hypothetical protein